MKSIQSKKWIQHWLEEKIGLFNGSQSLCKDSFLFMKNVIFIWNDCRFREKSSFSFGFPQKKKSFVDEFKHWKYSFELYYRWTEYDSCIKQMKNFIDVKFNSLVWLCVKKAFEMCSRFYTFPIIRYNYLFSIFCLCRNLWSKNVCFFFGIN